MAKIIIMQGLPASGKSTKAEELVKQGRTVRINKDLLRTMLHFNKFTGVNEGLTRMAARILAREFLLDGVNVIIDDTNLNEGTLQSWVDLAKQTEGVRIQHIKMDTPIDECIERDSKREKKVGRSVIVSMALQAGMYPKPKNGFVICDIDGTIADIRHRLHFVRTEGEKKDWKSFFEAIPLDTVRHDTLGILAGHLAEGREIIFVSARPDTYRKETERFIESCVPAYTAILMRRGGDKRPDVDVKTDILKSHFPDLSLIHEVIDDRPSVIRMWREQGLKVVDVGSGVEF